MPARKKSRATAPTVVDAERDAAHGPQTETSRPEPPSSPPRRWRWSLLADSSTTSHPPLFTRDGSYFFSIVGSFIKIHSATSGKIISTLPGSQRDAHTDVITSAVLSSQNAFQLITASLDGTIKVWDFLDGVLLRTIRNDYPIYHMCTHEKHKDHLFVVAFKRKKSSTSSQDPPRAGPADASEDERCKIFRVSLKAQASGVSEEAPKSSFMPIGKVGTATGIAVSASGERLIVVAGRKAYVAQTSNLKAGFTNFTSPEPITCLAVHPFEDYFATGDALGVVRLWYCLDPKLVKAVGVEKKAQTSALHWHAHAVSSVAFSTNGAYLLSGGEESVLVIWQLHSGKHEFVPRVGSPIANIVVSPPRAAEEEYLLGLADASYAFVSSATLKLSRVFSRIKLDPSVSNSRASSSSTPLAVHRLSDTLILPSSHPSSLQAYSPSTFTLVAELEVSPSNRISRPEDKPLEPARVERATISPGGEWMATIDNRAGDGTFRAEIYLKLWYWDKKTAFWILNTRIDRPHGLATVTSLSFRPSTEDAQLVTTGEDGNVKAWRIRRVRNKKGIEEVSWTSRSSFSHRSDIPRHTSWSHDGSLLAVPIGSSVVIFDPNTNVVRQSFVIQECRQPCEVHFIGRTGRYLAIIGGADLVVWDIIAQSVNWHLKNRCRCTMVMSHPYHDTFIAIHSSALDSSSITQFRATSPDPIMECPLPFGILNIAWFSQLSSALSSDFSLVAVTNDYNVVVLGDDVVLPEDPGASARPLQRGLAAPRRSLFEEMFGVSPITNPQNPHEARQASADQGSNGGVTMPWRSGDTANFFDAPSHLMPPIETFFEPLIASFLRLRTVDDATPAAAAEDGAAQAEDGMLVDVAEEPGPVDASAASNEAILDMFTPLFKEMADAPDYAYPPHKTAAPKKAVNGINEKHTKAVLHAPTKKSAHPGTQTVPSGRSVAPIPSKTGRKRRRPTA